VVPASGPDRVADSVNIAITVAARATWPTCCRLIGAGLVGRFEYHHDRNKFCRRRLGPD
jgi:hypothetical protein